MLILTRKVGESIVIADDIRIVVVRLKCGTVRIGIEAPPHIPVRRGELATRPTEEAVCAD